MSTVTSRKLQALLAPKRVAVVGGDAAAIVIRQCQKIEFSGELLAVNPSRKSLAGVSCVESLDQLAEPPDAAFLGLSPGPTIQAVRKLRDNGAGGAVCYASGFAEAGTEGEKLQRELLVNAGSMPIVGPNCHGFINFLDGVALWPDHFGGSRTDKGPALLMQSGNIAINVTFQQRELNPAYVIAMGNNAQVDVHDYMHAMLDDPRVTAIGLHLEGINNVPEFTRAAIRALEQKVPLVALKSGSSRLGAELALSHTRSLANPDDLVSLMFERYGVARCTSLPEFLETLKFVSIGGAIIKPFGLNAQDSQLEEGDRQPASVASLSCSGGEASHLADLAARYEIDFPTLSEVTTSALSQLLGERVHVSNPLDYHTYAWGDLELLSKAFTHMLSDGFDCALLILDYPPPERYDVSLWQVAEQALCVASAATGTRIVVVASLVENFPACARARLSSLGVAPMQGLHECVQAIAHANIIGRAQKFCDDLMPVTSSLVDNHSSELAVVLDEVTSKQELAAIGLAVPESVVCRSERAVDVSESLGFPLVIKATGDTLSHKTEQGAVRLGIGSAAEVRQHAKELALISEQLLVETMIDDAVIELLVGVVSEPDYGLMMMLGTGGVQVELMKDTVQLLLPASSRQIREALLGLKTGPLMTGFRGSKPADIDAAVEAIQLIARYAHINSHRLLELDVNPLLVRPADRLHHDQASQTVDRNAGAVVVDALIRMSH